MLLETERLVCEPAAVEHRDFVVELFGDPEVARWIWPEGRAGTDTVGPRTAEQAEELLARFLSDWRANGFGWWCVRERATGDPIGEVCVQRATVDGEAVVEVGWMLLPSRWGRGYATEAARAALGYGFATAGLDEIVAFTLPHNRASRAVMERLGMTYAREFEHVGLRHVLYRLPRPA